jgi:hypothetical protein
MIGLRALGLSEMTVHQFFEPSREFSMHNGGCDFQNRHSDWHSQMADISIKTSPSPIKETVLLICGNCCNIPLKDRLLEHHVTWMSMILAEEVYLEHANSERLIPNGLSMLVLDEDTANDPILREFFRELGVRFAVRIKSAKGYADSELKKAHLVKFRRMEIFPSGGTIHTWGHEILGLLP